MEEKEKKPNFFEKTADYIYYVLIGVISLMALVFLPMCGSTIGLEWKIPNTVIGWIVWVVTKLIMATINILIFHSFVSQGKVNIKDNEKYLQARKMLYEVKPKNYAPRSPKQFFGKEYSKKGTTIFITTALATVALTQAVLSFDLATMLSYVFTIIMGIVFGILEMLKVQDYWTNEFYDFALLKYKASLEDKNQHESLEVGLKKEVADEQQKENSNA